jgi:hypothetical protein
LLTAANTTFSGSLRQTPTVTSATAYTISAFVKKNNWRYVGLRFSTSTFGATEQVPFYDFDTDAVSNGGVTGATITRTLVGNGWVRLAMTFTSTSTSGTSQIWITDSNGATAPAKAGTESVYVWGAQLEAGAFPTSYIPTTTTALTRAADVASVNTLNPWYNSSAGTIYAEATGPIATIYRLLAEGASAADFRDFSLAFDGLRGNFTSRFVTGNYDVLSPSNSLTAGATVKLAGSYSSTSADLAYGGVLAVTKNAATQRIPADRIFLGSRLGTSLQLNGHLRRLTYYPRTLSTAELQAITA